MGLLVLRRAAIPAVSAPDWTIPDEGQWAEVGLDTIDDHPPAQNPDAGPTFTNSLNGFYTAWASACYAPRYGGAYGSIIIPPNGGHTSYVGSDMLAIDVATGAFSRICDPYHPASDGLNEFGEYPDGRPMAPHNYHREAIFPNEGDGGVLVMTGTYQHLSEATQTDWTHWFDIAVGAANMGTALGWSRGPENPTNGGHNSSAYDSNNNCIWTKGDPSMHLVRINPDKTLVEYTTNDYLINQPGAMCVDTSRNLLFHWSTPGARRLHVTDLDSPGTEPTAIFMDGPSPTGGMYYVAATDEIVAMDADGVWYLDPANPSGGWEQAEASDISPPTPVNNFYNKHQFIPSLGVLFGVSRQDTKAYAYKVRGA